MVTPKVTGSRITSLIQVSLLELELEANALLDRAVVERAKLVADGVSSKDANKRISTSILTGTDFAQPWNNKADKIITEMTKQLVAKPVKVFADENPKFLYSWVLGSVKTRHCPDCLRLSNMEPQTLKDWESHGKGLPREGLTVCNVGCKCMLKPISEVVSTPVNPKGTTTEELFTNAKGEYTQERQALHTKIIDGHFRNVPKTKGQKEFLLMGGGTASGKSSVKTKQPSNTVFIDSDKIKGQLPEYAKALKTNDPDGARFVHAESSYLSKKILARASQEGYNMTLDGTGDGTMKSFRKKVAYGRDAGETIRAVYITISIEEALKRETLRAKGGRKVPEDIIIGTHTKVSQVVPQAIKEGLYDDFQLWDNNGPKAQPPVLVATAKGKELTIIQPKMWKAFLAKADG